MSATEGAIARFAAAAGPGRPDAPRRGSRVGRVVFAAVAMGVVVAVGGCTAGVSSMSTAADEPARAGVEDVGAAPSAAPEVDGEFAAAAEAASPGMASADSSGSAASADQQLIAGIDVGTVIRTADLSIRLAVPPVPETDDATADREADAAARAAAINQAAAAARGIATAVGGFQSSADGGGSTMTISLRVPAEQYDAVLERLAGLGEVTSRMETSQDVTAEVVDVNSRVASMTASVARVRALLAQATTIAEVISIESELAVREANLESLQQQQAYLDGQVSLSTVSMTLTAVTDDPAAVAPAEEDTGFIAGITAGWAALLAFFGWVGGAVGAILPFLPLLAVAGVLIWWLIRRARRRRAARSAPVPAPPVAAEPARPEPEPAGVGSA